jgi:hypothetical protein
MVQTMGLALCAGIGAGRDNLRGHGRILRVGVFRGGSSFAFRERYALRRVSFFHVRVFVVGLDWGADEQLNLKRKA